MNNSMIYLCAIALLIAPVGAWAEVKVNPVFSDNMVLQRGMSVPVWGTADADETVTVKFADQTKTAKADKDGKWSVKLDAMKACAKAQSMTVGQTGFKDVLVGDVWVGSGQSNMAGGAGGYAKRDEGLAKLIAADYPLIRLARGDRPGWKQATAANAKGFSALLFSFGAPLQKELKIPVGLIVGAVGGTPSGRWLSPEAFEADEACKAATKAYEPKYQADLKKYEESLAKWKSTSAAAIAAAKAAGKRPPRGLRAPGKPIAGGDLFIRHIRPIIPYAIRGVVWDQGESRTQISGVDQFTVMGALIRGWRTEWKQDFPFIYIQKPSGGGCAWDKKDNPVTNQASDYSPKLTTAKDGTYRELHIRIMQHANTFMATSSDLGSGVHPINKSGYGLRACRVALGTAYKQDVEIYGPVYDSHKVEGAVIRISYKHVGKGLAFKGGDKLTGFQVAGDDGKFEWADAKIDGETVVLSCEKIAKPTAARYAWARNRPWANLFNKDGLPALAFETKK